MRMLFEYPIHPLANRLMILTEEWAIPDPFFSRKEEAVISLLLYYLEDKFHSFQNEDVAYQMIVENPDLLQTSLNVFKRAFSELPDTSNAKQVFMKTSYAQSMQGWEQQEQMVFLHTMLGLRKRFKIDNQRKMQLDDNKKIDHPFEMGHGFLSAGED